MKPPLAHHRLFVYGTLQWPHRVREIIGRALPVTPARLNGYRCGQVARADFPGIVPDDNARLWGQLLSGISAAELGLLDRYEGELYRRIRVNIRIVSDSPSQRTIPAWVYVIAPWARERVARQSWSLEWYRQQPGRLTYRS